MSYLMKRGQRLRLTTAPVGRLIDSTFVEKNYNGGGVVAQETVKEARAVTVTLFHDDEHPSSLFVPIGRDEIASERDRAGGASNAAACSLRM